MHGIVRVMTPPLDRVDHLPDGVAGLCFVLFAEGKGTLFAVGPSSRAIYTRPDPFVVAIHVGFAPASAYPYLGVPLDVLADRHVAIRDLWGDRADRLLDDLFAAGTALDASAMRSRIGAIDRALSERLTNAAGEEPPAAALARAAVDRLAHAAAPFRDLASELQISDRNLRRAFASSVGLSPKVYARVARFRRVIAQLPTARGRLGAIAHAAGYADQSHLVNEFRELTGVSPSAFMRPDATEHLRTACPMARRGSGHQNG